LDAIFRMLAPITPFFAEECYYHLTGESVHAQEWVDFHYEDKAGKEMGDLLISVVAEVRRYKHDSGMALNAPMGEVVVYSQSDIDDANDASSALNADVKWKNETPKLEKVISGVSFDMSVIGPNLRNKAKVFMDAVRNLPEEELRNPPAAIVVDGEELPVPGGAFAPEFTYQVAGKAVDILTISDDVIVTVRQNS
ncbi:MAG: class I tRNA ligase family protein, partial [Methanogenium sp.]|nr:class I tRNA ligase family protein [Methanogenium sp.]